MTTAAVACAGSISAATVAPVEAAPSAAAAAPAPASTSTSSPARVRIGRNADFTRVEFSGPNGLRTTIRRSGRTVVVTVQGSARPDIAQLRVDPPPGVRGVDVRAASTSTTITFLLAEGADIRTGRADGAVYLNLMKPVTPAAGAAANAAPAAASDQGVVKVEAQAADDRQALRFPFSTPVAAAVFRRGGAVWIVFDAKARLDVAQALRNLGPAKGLSWTSGDGWTVVRLAAPEGVAVTASAVGPTWNVGLGGPARPALGDVRVGRDEQTGPAAVTVAVAGATRVVWIKDPLIGDRFAAVTARAPAKGLGRPRGFVEAALLQTQQGLAIEAPAQDLDVAIEGELVRISRPGGISLSPAGAEARAAAPEELPKPALMSGLVDFEGWSKTGEGGFRVRYQHLQDLAAAEAAQGANAPVTARMALARFLVGSELSYEAIGVLDLIGRQKEAMLGDPEFRGLRGAARAMVGRWVEAQTDFSVPQLADDPAASLWRGYIDARQGHNEDARKAFAAGARAVDRFTPRWRARFAIANADVALQLGDQAAASSLINFALGQQGQGAEQQLAARLVQARVLEAQGQTNRALGIYDAVARAPLDRLSMAAQLRATRIRLDKGEIKPVDAVNKLNGLRFRWRGDATELELIRTLGDIYLSQGRYREALEALRSAGTRLPNLPAAMELQADLAAAFRALFLEGQADGLEPVQALALFYDFRELTPVGAEGDDMVRRLARRLVDVDLLSQAAELLKYQVENRLDGVAKAQVATDLASIYLMDRKPEPALQAIWGSRTTLLPNALNAERRVIEARALAGLTRYDNALEVLGSDQGADAQDVRSEIFWRQKNWAQAAAILERRLGDRWKNATALSGDEETRLIRTGIAYSLANDDAALARLNEHWNGFVAGARSPDALRVALARNVENITPAQFADASAQADTFAGWVAAMKKRFREKPVVTPAAAPAPRAPPQPPKPAARAA
jgi:tetratricopeptide (TPR) repeat protein